MVAPGPVGGTEWFVVGRWEELDGVAEVVLHAFCVWGSHLCDHVNGLGAFGGFEAYEVADPEETGVFVSHRHGLVIPPRHPRFHPEYSFGAP